MRAGLIAFGIMGVLCSCGSTAPKSGAEAPQNRGGSGAPNDASSAASGTDSSTGGDALSDAPRMGTYDGSVIDGACPKLPGSGAWQNVSPPGSNYKKTYSGMISVVVRPDNPAVIYAGADSNGNFKSTDCGATWALVNTGANAQSLSSGRPWSFVIDPVIPDIMYVVEGYGASGLWKSTNAGVDWTQILTPNVTSAFNGGGQITSIALDPTDHTHIVVESHQGQDSAAGMCGTDTCIAESTDSGVTWKLLTIPIAWVEDSSVAILNRTTWLHCSIYKSIWYTQDEGVTWHSSPTPNGAVVSCNWYQPYVWQTSAGEYVLPSTTQGGSGGIFLAASKSISSWTLVANSPQGQMLMATANNLVVGGGNSAADAVYAIASQSDPTTWKPFPGPPTGTPVAPSVGGFPEFMAYDGAHHVLYVSTYTTGLWQAVIE
jgi:hypothetical protein